MSVDIKRYEESKLRGIMERIFMGYGLSAESAQIVADNLVEADLRGVSSHGIMRTKSYCTRLAKGQINPADAAEVVSDRQTTAMIDGHNTFGAVSGTMAMKLAIEKAEKYGVAVSTVSHSTHFGACAYYAEMATRKGLISIVASNTVPIMAPIGGKAMKVGNNPIAFAVPAGKHFPIILDIATSQVAMGKILLAAKEGREIPLGWATDKDGVLTTDPVAAQDGFLFPTGGHKGLGIAIFAEMITGVLAGANFGGLIENINKSDSARSNYGHFFLVIDPSFFLGAEDFTSKVDAYIDYFKDCPMVDKNTEALLPGEIECTLRLDRRANGIPEADTIITDLKTLAEGVGVDWHPFFAE